MSISIVITNYNLARYVLDAVQSALGGGEEVIVVDDGSSDGSVQILNSFAATDHRVKILVQSNQGSSSARNLGARHARCKYILFLDADDLLLPGAVSLLAAMLESESTAVCAYGQWRPIDESGRKMPPRMKLVSRCKGFILKQILVRAVIGASSALIRKDAFFSAGGFNPSVKFGEDWEFLCRLALQGNFLASEAFIIEYRIRRDSKSSSQFLERKSRLCDTIDRVFSNVELNKHFSESELARLKRKSRACALVGLSTRSFWEGYYKRSLHLGLGAAWEYPLLAPRVAGRLILNCFMFALSRAHQAGTAPTAFS